MPYRGAVAGTGSDNSVEVSFTGAQVGDKMLAFILTTASAATITSVPAGWAQMMERSPSGFKLWLFHKNCASGENLAPVWGLSQSTGWLGDSWFGPAGDSPVITGADNTGLSALAVSGVAPADGCTVVTYRAVDTGTAGQGRTWTVTGTPTPSGQTERIDTGGTTAYRVLADEVLTATSGTSISRTGTVTGGATPISGIQILLPPVPAVANPSFFLSAH